MPARVLVVDDEPAICSLLESELGRREIEVETTGNPEQALERLKENPVDVVLTDIQMPEMDGLTLLRRIKTVRPNCEVIVMTAFASVETAREALKCGAVDYLTKPFSVRREVIPLLEALLEIPADTEVPAPSQVLAADVSDEDPFKGIVGRGGALQELLKKIQKVAPSEVPVLLHGQSGSGKEVMACAIHRLSKRSAGPLVKINCAALPETLLESTLFGHVRGAFTGATSDREGLFQAADGGTLFLDEIGEISTSFQPKLLRVLQDGEFRRVGEARKVLRVDVRVVAATNRDLEQAMRDGAFRADLFYRLNVVPLVVPSLTERREDLPELIEHFLREFAEDRALQFSSRALETLESYHWPGNVRELANAVQQGVLLRDGEQIEVWDLPAAIQQGAPRESVAPELDPRPSGDSLESVEIRCIRQALHKTGGNRTRAAQLLGLTRRALGYRIQKYGLEPSNRSIPANS
ncbi:MAG: sigma-54-dependent Fis family transcriptional regulator [Myxococcales bacterium]|nr:sigma-54-dependent Fis family transcriptional regulator [Myxococcales bacterium]